MSYAESELAPINYIFKVEIAARLNSSVLEAHFYMFVTSVALICELLGQVAMPNVRKIFFFYLRCTLNDPFNKDASPYM